MGDVDFELLLPSMSADDIEHRARFLSASDRSRVFSQVVFHRRFRPDDKDQQMVLLRRIAANDELSFSVRLYATIAAGYKSMELGSISDAKVALGDVRSISASVHLMSLSSQVREDRIHAWFSAQSISWQLALYVGSADEFFRSARECEAYFVDSRSEFGPVFFYSVWNVSGCLAISALAALAEGDREGSIRRCELMESAFAAGLDVYDKGIHSSVVLSEYLGSTRTLHACMDLKEKLSAGRTVDPEGRNATRLLSRALRTRSSHMTRLLVESYEAIVRMQ